MRLPLLSPSHLSPQQQKRSGDMRQGTESNFKGFQAISDGALIGPWKWASEVVMPSREGRRVRLLGTWNPWDGV